MSHYAKRFFGKQQSNLMLHLDASNSSSYSGSGSTWYDLSGNGRNANLVGSPTFDATNKDFYFGAVGKYITLPNNINLYPGSGSYTWRMYIKNNFATNYQSILYSMIPYTGSGNGIGFYGGTVSRVYMKVNDGTNSATSTAYSAGAYSNVYTWFTIVLNRADNTLKLYTGTTLRLTLNISSIGALNNVGTPVLFGASGGAFGYAQKLKFYNKALSTSEFNDD